MGKEHSVKLLNHLNRRGSFAHKYFGVLLLLSVILPPLCARKKKKKKKNSRLWRTGEVWAWDVLRQNDSSCCCCCCCFWGHQTRWWLPVNAAASSCDQVLLCSARRGSCWSSVFFFFPACLAETRAISSARRHSRVHESTGTGECSAGKREPSVS